MKYVTAAVIPAISLLFCAAMHGQPAIRIKDRSREAEITGIEIYRYRDYQGVRRGRIDLTLTTNREEGDIVGLRADSCKLESLTDDQGGILDEEVKMANMGTAIGWYPAGISADGASAGVKLMVTTLPSKGASQLTAAGTIVVLVGTSRQISRERDFQFTPGKTVAAGETVLKLETAELPEEQEVTVLTFLFEGLPGRIVALEYLDAEGEPIRQILSERHVVSMNPDGTASSRITSTLDGRVSSAGMRITFWESVKEMPVPFDVTAGLGLRSRTGNHSRTPTD